ncbi:hypothetical protein V8C86DRAFT_3026786 [Haematococcus lacustris]
MCPRTNHSGETGLLDTPCAGIDLVGINPTPLAVTRQSAVTCVAFHPELPLLGIATGTFICVFDVLSGTRLGRVNMSVRAVQLSFTPDGALLVAVLQDWRILGTSLSTWHSHVLVPRYTKADRPLDCCLLAITAGSRGALYFVKLGKEVVRTASFHRGDILDAQGKPLKDKGGSWGLRVKHEAPKPILGLAAHPSEPLLLLLSSDGQLRGFNVVADDAMSPTFSVQVQDPSPKVHGVPGTLLMLPHPLLPGGCLILQVLHLDLAVIVTYDTASAARLGQLCILEMGSSPGSSPVVALKASMQGWAVVLGMGMVKDLRQVFAYGLSETGRVRATSWRLLGREQGAASPGSSLQQQKVDPADLAALLDPLHSSTGPCHTPVMSLPAPTSGAQLPAWDCCPAWAAGPHTALSVTEANLGPVVSRVVVHPVLGLAALSLEPAFTLRSHLDLLQQPLSSLVAEEYRLARKLLHLPLLSCTNLELPGWGAPLAAATPCHTRVATWNPGRMPATPQVVLPAHLFFISQAQLMKYSLVPRTTRPLLSLPTQAPSASCRRPVSLVSGRGGAWLMFFEVLAGQAGPGVERWQWSLVLAAGFEVQATPAVWLKPGKAGVFIGPEDAHFVVIEATGQLAAVFRTADTTHAGAAPLYTLSLFGSSLAGGTLASPLFPGPEGLLKPGGHSSVLGTVLWQAADRSLVACSLPPTTAEELVPGEAQEEQEEGEEGWEAPPPTRVTRVLIEPGQHLGTLAWQLQLPLLPGELVLQVAWQALSLDTADPTSAFTTATAAAAEPGAGDQLGAVLTNKRLLLVNGLLQLHAALPLSPLTVAWPMTSVLWAGPLLLGLMADGRVLGVTASGASHTVCHVVGSPSTMLLAATPDTLLLLRPSQRGANPGSPVPGKPAAADACVGGGGAEAWEVVARPTSLIQSLVLGWADLSLLAGGTSDSRLLQCRSALHAMVEAADVSQLTASAIWGLIAACAFDLASALATHSSGCDSSMALAASASAAKWGLVAPALRAALRNSSLAQGPGGEAAPPARNSPHHTQIMAAAAGALAQGQASKAEELLQMAGEWLAAMVVAAARGDIAQVRQLAHNVATGAGGLSPDLGPQALRLATALTALYGDSGQPVADLSIDTTSCLSHTPLPSATDWQLGGPGLVLGSCGAVPASFKPVSGSGEDAAPTLGLLRAGAVSGPLGLVPYLGLEAARQQALSASLTYTARTVQPGARGSGAKAGAVMPPAAQSQGSLISLSSDHTASRSNLERGGSAPLMELESPMAPPSPLANPQRMDSGDPSSFNFSDTDSDLDSPRASPQQARKIMVAIRAKEASTDVGKAGPSLHEAVKGLRLAPPGADPGLALPPAPGQAVGSRAAVLEGAAVGSAVPPAGLSPALAAGLSPALVAGLQPPPPAPPAAQTALQGPPDALYYQGVAAMEARDWSSARVAFAGALAGKPGLQAGDGAKRTFVAQYLAAVELLSCAMTEPRAVQAAAMYRYIAALQLDVKHSMVLQREAASRNKDVGNGRYVADLLTDMAMRLAGYAPEPYLTALQTEIAECDKIGSNANVSGKERVDEWVARGCAAHEREASGLLGLMCTCAGAGGGVENSGRIVPGMAYLVGLWSENSYRAQRPSFLNV